MLVNSYELKKNGVSKFMDAIFSFQVFFFIIVENATYIYVLDIIFFSLEFVFKFSWISFSL